MQVDQLVFALLASNSTSNGTTHEEGLSHELMEKLEIVHIVAVAVTAIFMVLAIVISVITMIMHLLNYTKPAHQRYILRILFMVPVYVVNSWLSLVTKRQKWFVFLDLFRDCYEAYIIYIFFKYCVCILGGLEATELLMSMKHKHRCTLPFCCIKFQPNRAFYRRCLQGCIQYVVIKPTMTLLSIVFFIFNRFEEGDFNPTKGYLYISIVNNISVCIALYALATFYETMAVELGPHKPLLKFLCIKGVIFFTYWQSVGISILVFLGVFGHEEEVKKFVMDLVNDGLVCTEMVIAAIALFFAFSYKPYIVDNDDELVEKTGFQKLMYRLRRLKPDKINFWKTQDAASGVIHATNQVDVLQDTVYSVNPLADRKSKKQRLDEEEEQKSNKFLQLGEDHDDEHGIEDKNSPANAGYSAAAAATPSAATPSASTPFPEPERVFDSIHMISTKAKDDDDAPLPDFIIQAHKQPDFSADFDTADIAQSRPATDEELKELQTKRPDKALETFKLRPPKKLAKVAAKIKKLAMRKKYNQLDESGSSKQTPKTPVDKNVRPAEELEKDFENFKRNRTKPTIADVPADIQHHDIKLGFDDSFDQAFSGYDKDDLEDEVEIELTPQEALELEEEIKAEERELAEHEAAEAAKKLSVTPVRKISSVKVSPRAPVEDVEISLVGNSGNHAEESNQQQDDS